MIFAHGGNRTLLTSDEFSFLAKNYPWVTFADCYGINDGVFSEDATLAAARAIKAVNPAAKVNFYWKSDMAEQLVDSCSNANATWAKHPEWHLIGDDKKPIMAGHSPVFDTTVASFRTFWAQHLVTLAGTLGADGTPLLSGFFIDGCQQRNTTIWKNLNPTRTAALVAASTQMVKEAQAAVTALGHNQVLIWNALDDDLQLANHVAAAGGSMGDHFGALQFINPKTGDWVPDTLQYLMMNITRSPLNADRLIQVKGWAGPLIHPKTWVNESQPKTSQGLQLAMAAELNVTLASFLLIAEDQSWLGYSWFWDMGDYIPYGKNHTCPDDFYPAFSCPLGAPAGPPVNVGGYVWERRFASALVHVELDHRTASGVIWDNCPQVQRP
jgi:hypothetical protein